jgi:secreted Zn-dependent insulinase-like peptidase
MAASGDAPALAVCIVLVTAQRQITAMEDTDLAAAVIKSPADKKEYRLLRLPNGLNALLIHDPSINVNQAS